MKGQRLPPDLKHLGGHLNITHIDTGVLSWAKENLGISSFLDIGCGPGGMVELALDQGLAAMGIDGDPTIQRKIINNFVLHDYSVSALCLDQQFDLAWSCEFVEHVDQQFVNNYMVTFQCCRHVIMTYAPPGTPGHHHVNCQSEQYWIDIFAAAGFDHKKTTTDLVRAASTMQRNFVRDHGMYFERRAP
jgi:SAM-dependent methyltransferase